MSPAALLAELRALGVELRVEGDRIRCKAPRGSVTPELAEAIRSHKPALLALLTTPTVDDEALTMPLDVFAVTGHPLEIRVPWWSETLWFVPGARDAGALCREGVARHRIWTAAELVSVLASSDLSTDALITVMVVRQHFDGVVVEVHHRRSKEGSVGGQP